MCYFIFWNPLGHLCPFSLNGSQWKAHPLLSGLLLRGTGIVGFITANGVINRLYLRLRVEWLRKLSILVTENHISSFSKAVHVSEIWYLQPHMISLGQMRRRLSKMEKTEVGMHGEAWEEMTEVRMEIDERVCSSVVGPLLTGCEDPKNRARGLSAAAFSLLEKNHALILQKSKY